MRLSPGNAKPILNFPGQVGGAVEGLVAGRLGRHGALTVEPQLVVGLGARPEAPGRLLGVGPHVGPLPVAERRRAGHDVADHVAAGAESGDQVVVEGGEHLSSCWLSGENVGAASDSSSPDGAPQLVAGSLDPLDRGDGGDGGGALLPSGSRVSHRGSSSRPSGARRSVTTWSRSTGQHGSSKARTPLRRAARRSHPPAAPRAGRSRE
jgi:hypothetical protein